MDAIKVVSQKVIGYRRQRSETVFESVWLMSDGTTETRYDGNIYGDIGEPIQTVEYGTKCPDIELYQASPSRR